MNHDPSIQHNSRTNLRELGHPGDWDADESSLYETQWNLEVSPVVGKHEELGLADGHPN